MTPSRSSAFAPLERVAISRAVEAAVGERRGRPKVIADAPALPLGDTGEKPDDGPEFPPDVETREFAARASGFASDRSFRDAKTVVDNAANARRNP
jgi:hypothetical protein